MRVLLSVPMLVATLAIAVAAEETGDAEGKGAVVAPQLPAPDANRIRAADEPKAPVDVEVTDVASFVKWAQAARDAKVRSLYKRRETIRAEKGNSRFKRERIEKTNEEILRINNPAEPYVPRVSSLKLITLDDLSSIRFLEVLQVVDDKNARVKFVEISAGVKQLEFFLTGLDTAGWVDGQKLALKGALIADGAKSFNTTDGAQRTIAVMKNYEVPKEELTRRADVRTWTNENGETAVGALVLYDLGKVTIMNLGGKAENLKLVELSPADREYVDQHAPTPPRKGAKGAAGSPPDVPK